ncbi:MULTISPECIES: polysaccharide biosynthesis tyrosine autokinase [unclassified Rhodococcus (in: high G+C Gram-positive bacteria)]|uniref:polysaccharide biosynthesis tyrosine autokinase n=1 Tax=unclassified Rhodococcus (in: high G+C Gram-positive bacteria) TaxID=192944 RepID=UPI000E0C4F81|nr:MULTISPECIES: polysaccharide biosynthesis tyrosine autokinase [unclassified Rhodococcus (in: high G+C Gram-positive bacteria)]QKT13216.1 polysaccharide biosynthesis tyrosine autokinase [Rhodococcus sp. W8901]RDI26803.1 receptor protein-tyrosine kinase [Rhodococcus sp. AG1013]
MEVQDYLRIVQTRWRIIALTTLVGILVALGASLMSTPMYQASSRLFVSTSSGASVNEVYQGNLFSQQRVASYTKLLTGSTLAQRTLDKLGKSDLTAEQLAKKVKATSTPDTVLIDTKVTDASPEVARDLVNALSDEFVLMAEELESMEVGKPPMARVVVEQHASTPSTPVSPKTKRNLALGFVVGLLGGIALAVLRDRLDNTVKSREVLDELAGVGLVGTVPFDKDREEKAAIAFQDGYSGSAEAFRELRTNLQFLEVDNPPRVIAITSSLPGEGKTTTAINLSLAIAEAGYSVALVDADLRRPRIAKYLDLIGSVGMSTVLAGQADIDDVLQSTPFPNVSVLASGPLPPNPSELLGSTHAEKLFADLRSRFDFVIIDASPLLPVTDAAVLAVKVDGALVVVKHGQTKREQVSRAIGNLRSVGATVLGTILTMTPAKGKGAYEYKYYYDSDAPVQKVEDAPAKVDPAPLVAQAGQKVE